MGSAILRIHLQSLFLLVHLIRMLTSWLVLRGSQFCTAEGNTVVCRGKGRLKLLKFVQTANGAVVAVY